MKTIAELFDEAFALLARANELLTAARRQHEIDLFDNKLNQSITQEQLQALYSDHDVACLCTMRESCEYCEYNSVHIRFCQDVAKLAQERGFKLKNRWGGTVEWKSPVSVPRFETPDPLMIRKYGVPV